MAQCDDSGNVVIFDTGGSYIMDKSIGEKTELIRDGNIFNVRLWARAAPDNPQKSGFARPER